MTPPMALTAGKKINCKIKNPVGFTLIEVVIVIVILGIIAAVAIPSFGDLTENSKEKATQSELLVLKKAIIGNGQAVAGGRYIDIGYYGDVGTLPDSLKDLVVKPASIAAYDRFTRRGWNGPYIDSSGGDYLTDAWNAFYVYNKTARTLKSVGGSDTITVTF